MSPLVVDFCCTYGQQALWWICCLSSSPLSSLLYTEWRKGGAHQIREVAPKLDQLSERQEIHRLLLECSFHLAFVPKNLATCKTKDWGILFIAFKMQLLQAVMIQQVVNTMVRLIKLCSSLLQKMLTYNPPKRISAREAMTHPYFDDLDKSTLPAASINKI